MASGRGLGLDVELGGKHSGAFTAEVVDELVAEGTRWLEAGAHFLVIEARESARDVGVFDSQGKFGAAAAERFAQSFGLDRLLFEAPDKQSQFALLDHFGPELQLRTSGSRNCCASRSTGVACTQTPFPSRRSASSTARNEREWTVRWSRSTSCRSRARAYTDGWAVVAIDLMRATTTAVTIAHSGRRCLPVASPKPPTSWRSHLPIPCWSASSAVTFPRDSISKTARWKWNVAPTSSDRPFLLSSSGTRLIDEATPRPSYAACLRNAQAQVEHLAGRYPRVAVIGAGTKGEFRREDQYGCARIGAGLLDAGYSAADRATHDVVERWREAGRGVRQRPQRRVPAPNGPSRGSGVHPRTGRRHRRCLSPRARRAGRSEGDVTAATPVVVLKLYFHGGVGLVRTLGRMGVPVHVVADDLSLPAAHSRYITQIFEHDLGGVPERRVRRFPGRVADRVGGGPILITSDDTRSRSFLGNAAALRERFAFPEQPSGLSERLLSKRGLYELCLDHGVPSPACSFPPTARRRLRRLPTPTIRFC